MNEQLDIEQITQRLKTSFQPYKCVVEEKDYKNAICIHVIDRPNITIIHIKTKPISKINNESKLSTYIEQLKETIRGKGYQIT